MNIPEVVLAAMAICNQHVIATKWDSDGFLYRGNSLITTGCYDNFGSSELCKELTAAEKKAQEDTKTEFAFDRAFAWQPEYEDKCLKIQMRIDHVQAAIDKAIDDKKTADETAKKAAEQPALDKGVAALMLIR